MSKIAKTVQNLWLRGVVIVAIAFCYLWFAPNYQWSEHSGETAYGADFLQEWTGAHMIITGKSNELYDVNAFRAQQHDSSIVGFEWASEAYFPPVYPPPHYAVFSPLACLPYRWATIVWLLTLITCVFASAQLIQSIVIHGSKNQGIASVQAVKDKCNYLWIGLILFPSLLFSITLGQKSVCWLLIICATWRLLQCNRDFSAGLIFGILSVKPTLFFLLPLVLLRNRRWQFFVGASSSVIAIWGITAMCLPFHTWVDYVHGLRGAGSYAENSGYRIDWSCNLMTFAYSLPAELAQWCKWSICLPLAVYLFYCVFEDKTYAIDSPEKALMILASTILISPHAYHYDLTILMLPILWLVVTSPTHGFVYFAMLSVGMVMSADVEAYLHVPILPLILIGMVCELRIRRILVAGAPRSAYPWNASTTA